MNFLNSAILAGLVAAIAPLLIHLLNRRRVKTIEFPSIMFLRDLRKTRMRRLQLRRWLLLAIRTLMVILIVLAFARPALKGGVFAGLGSRARTTAVVALDRSASMALETANGSAFERAQNRVDSIFQLLGEGDDAIALPFTAEPPLASQISSDFTRLNRQFDEMDVTSGNTDASQALNAAMASLRSVDNLNREVYLLTDMRRGGFTETVVPEAPSDDAAVTVYVLDVSEDGGFDLGVADVAVGDELVQVATPFSITADVVNYTDRPVDRLLVSLFVDGRRVGQEETALDANGRATVGFQTSVESAGIHSGFVELSADDNALNNRRHFAITIPDEVKVLLASDYPSSRAAARLALAPVPQTQGRIRITETNTDDLLGQNLFEYDCVIIPEWRTPDAAVVDNLLRYVRAGGGVFIAPAIDADTTAWNTLIATPHYGLRMGPNPAMPNPERYFLWADIDWEHPIWSVYRDVRRERFPEIRWFSIYRTEGEPTSRSVVNFSGGRQSISEVRMDAGKLLALWSPLNAPYSDLTLRSPFVPLMHRMVEYLSTDLSERRSDYLVGETIERDAVVSLLPEDDVQLVTPGGLVERPNVEFTGRGARIRIGSRMQTGVYTLTRNDQPFDAFSVNTDPVEFDMDRIDRGELERRWAGYHIVMIDREDGLETVVGQTRYGTEVRSAFLWMVMGLFLLEMLIAGARKRELPVSEPAPQAQTATT